MKTSPFFNAEADFRLNVSELDQKVQDCDPAEEEYSDLLAFEDSDLEELVITLS